MVTAHVGSGALVRLTGRLDGDWSRMGDRVLMMHRGKVVHDWSGVRKRRLRVDDLLVGRRSWS